MKPTVVVVDDEPAITDVVCEVLDEVEVAAVACQHGSRAVACIRETRPDLVILDVQMPGVDGVEVFRQMRVDPVTREIPVIFFTANADRLRQRLPNFQSMNAQLLPKPFQVDRLLAMVQAYAGKLAGRSAPT